MLISDKSRQQFGEALAKGIGALLKRDSSESWLTEANCLTGHVRITEALSGGPSAASYFAKQVEAISPAITRVTARPISLGEPAAYDIDINFDPKMVESLYSDGKSAIASLEKDGKKYVVGQDGKAVEVEDPDKYVNNLNKTTGSRYQKQAEDVADSDDVVGKLQKIVDEANVALQDTGVEVKLDGDKILLSGDAALVKPTQSALPDPLFGLEDLEGGYNAESGAMEVTIPKFADTRDVANLEEFLYKAVNTILDIVEKGSYTEEDEWSRLLADAEEDPAYASRYSYSGESFVGEDKQKGAKLIKSLMAENFDEAKKVASKLMGEKLAEQLLVAPAAKHPINESKQRVTIDEEAAILDMAHEAAVSALPHQDVNLDSFINPNLA